MPPRTRSKGSSVLTMLLLLVVVVIFGGYYMMSGADPLGLMGKPSATAVPPVAATAAATPRSPDVATEVATQPAAAGAVWWEVYFSPALHLSTSEELQYNQEIPAANFQGSITEKLVQRIDSAQKTIHIASFEMDLSDIANALIRAKQRGLDVRWITDDESGTQADTKPGRG